MLKLDSGAKVKVFEKKDLRNKLGFNEQEIKIVMRYQKEFPELLQEHTDNDFVVDARKLWGQLGNPYNHYNHWIERKVFKKNYQESIDYFNMDKKVHIENTNINREQKETFFTVDAAKHIAMSENTEKGREIRSYFILMERAIRDMDKWILVRNPEKEGYKQLCEAINSNYKLTHKGKEAHPTMYSNEADMINRSLLGAKAKKIRQILDVQDDKTRDNLTIQVNQALYELQLVDIALIMGQISFEQRKNIMQNVCRNKYIDITLAVKELEGVA
ncbi:antA/AntB antirepressor family protein [Paenibacillus sp. EKM208P]|nr:antA/AntB antirepressor family protein [Paenibacillus sp. EKM208P]